MNDLIEVEIATPTGEVLKTMASSVVLPGVEGDLEVLPGHISVLTKLRPGGVMTVVLETGESRRFALHDGFLEVGHGRVVVLADQAEPAENIDLQRAKAAEQRALERISKSKEAETDLERARRALARARARIAAHEGREV